MLHPIEKQRNRETLTVPSSSLIVLNYNGVDFLPACLDSLKAAMEYSAASHEVIVVDNASHDGSVELIERDYLWVRLLKLPTNRYIFGLMDGVALARYEYVWFLNNDIKVDNHSVDRVLRHFAQPDVFAVTARILEARTGLDQGSRTAVAYHRGLLFYEPLPHVPEVTDCFFAVGGQSAFDKAKLLEIGGLDTLFSPMYHEDIDLSYRAWKHGWRILYEPDAIIHHWGGVTTFRFRSQDWKRRATIKNATLLCWVNITDKDLLLVHIASIPLRLAQIILRRDWGALRAWLGAFRQLPAAMRSRKKAKTQFRLSDRTLLQRLSVAALSRMQR